MQMKKALELQNQRNARGKRRCNHPSIEREYYLGSNTGDYVCSTCGANVNPEKLRKKSRKAK